MQKLFSFLAPPIFGDEDRTREATYAHYIIITVVIGLGYSVIIRPYTENYSETFFKILALFSLSLSFILNKKNKFNSPLLVLVIISLAICAGLMVFDQGINDEILLGFPVILFVASLEFDRKSLIVTLFIQIIIVVLIGYLEINGTITNDYSSKTSYYQLSVIILLLLISSYIIDLLVNDFKKYIDLLKSNSKELSKANQELHDSNATKDKFFSIVAHDLRSPFQGLLGIANILESLDDELTMEERKDFVIRLNSALKRQYDFLEELLLWGKFQRNAVDFDPRVCSIKEIVERNYEILSGNIYKKKLHFKLEFSDEVNVKCDENLISTVIRNLLSNAIKYTPAGGNIWICIKDSTPNVVVEVKDTGIGLSEVRKKQLFKIETNTSTRGTEDEAGTGLGLILCKEIMEKHGGEIYVRSEEGRGSSFVINIPKEIN